MNEILKQLIDKKFSVYVSGEFERGCTFLGFIKLLSDYSDFFRYDVRMQRQELLDGYKKKEFYIDANVRVRFK